LEELLSFFFLIVAISASGALSPGPLLFATIDSALRDGGRVGWLIALGHTLFELPLVLAIALGVWSLIEIPLVKLIIGVLGSAALIGFGAAGIRSSMKKLRGLEIESAKSPKTSSRFKGSWPLRSIMIGLLFTGLNPYFLIWWFTIGLTLIAEAIRLASILGVFIMYVFHVWLDYACLGLVSHATAIGCKPLKPKHLNMVSLTLSSMLILIGFWILYSTITSL